MDKVGMLFSKDDLICTIESNYECNVKEINFDKFMKMVQDNFIKDPTLPDLMVDIIMSTLDDYFEEAKNERKTTGRPV